MKSNEEIKQELQRLEVKVRNAEGIDREDCPELSSKIEALQWVLEMTDEVGGNINLEIMIS